MSYFSQIKVRNSAGTVINPATQEAVDGIEASVATIATQQTSGTQQTKITDGTDVAAVVTCADRNTNLDGTNGLVAASVMFGRISDTIVKHVRSDAATDTLMAIDYAHHEIHDGSMFSYDDVVTLGNGATQNYVITVPNTTTWPHFGYDVESTAGGVTLELYEGSDRTPTTLQTVFNRNRNSATAATTTVHKNYTGGTTDGTRIIWRSSGTGAAAGKVAGTPGEATERILKQNTQYTLRVTSKAASNDVSVRLNWYEHANRN